MTGLEEGCQAGSAECDYRETHELPLVQKVLQTIELYNKEENVGACPACLRSAMLAVAALLHLEASRLQSVKPLPNGFGALEEEFGDAARESLREVTHAAAAAQIGIRQ